MIRLFVGLYPPVEAAEAMLAEFRTYEWPEHRETTIEQIHMTLQFIGDVLASRLDDIAESVERAAAGLKRFEVSPTHIITLPDVGHARLAAIETDGHPVLLEIKRRLVTRLARTAKDRSRNFRPHLTLCRFHIPVLLKEPLREDVELAPFAVDRIMLMKSTLRPDGAVHKQLAVVELG